jgi:hypothetical protein
MTGLLGCLACMSGCSGCASYQRCALPPPPLLGALPGQLSQTGLFADLASAAPEVLSEGVQAYAPRFELWSDGASKRRWVSLPEGQRIDSSDMDDWSFPEGTKLWKEFSRAGRRLETRLLVKVGPAERDWAGAAYVWDADQREARLSLAGQKDVGGVEHDVPSAAECGACHGGRRSHVLGFSALQLADDALPLTLADLVRQERLTRAPEQAVTLPGDEAQRAALGYLHANCGHCHNGDRPERTDEPRCYDPQRSIDFWLPSDSATDVRRLPAYTTTVPRFVTPGEPDDSRLITLVSRRGSRLHMPPLASRQVDADGVRRLREWITRLGESPASAQGAPPSRVGAASP